MGHKIKNSLYSPTFERDNCGFGLIANMDDNPSNWVIETSIEALNRLKHRGAVSDDGKSSDGSVLPYGAYTMTATAQIDGETTPLHVTTTAEVRSVKWNPQLQQLALEIGDGIYIPLTSVERISN